MLSLWLFALLIGIGSALLLQYHWNRRHIYLFASKLPGPTALPIIGNGLAFLCNSEDILHTITTLVSPYQKPLRFWFGPTLVVYFSDPRHLEKILSSAKMAYKHDFYDRIIKLYLGDGLVSNSGPKYKKHKRIIQPLINLRFVTNGIETFQKHINILLNKLNSHLDGKTFDIHDLIHFCFADICGELILGANIDAQNGKNLDYIHATANMYGVCHSRIMRPWLHPDAVYALTEGKKQQTHILDITTKFIKKVVDQTWKRIKVPEHKTDENTAIIDQIAAIIKNDPTLINEKDFFYHMFTLYAASEDTMTIISAILCMCLGMYPEYQTLAAEEIRTIFGDKPREVTYEDITKMKYMDMCIKEVMRLIPIAPIILRKTVEDFTIDNLTIPKDCGVLVSIFDVHRDSSIWEYPNDFYPNHFLPEKVTKRHPFAFVPFSAGPRGCIGKVMAMIGLKLFMANILQKFEIEADGKFSDVVLKSDITVRSASGYKVRLKPRKWR